MSSGTPSTDLCFAEYQLEKVRAYFTSTDEDEPIVRAYSIGSRDDYNRRNESDTSVDASRTRAFSVGSKVGVRFSGKQSGGSGSSTDSAGTGNGRSANGNKTVEDKGKKSSSAPVLGTSPFGNSWLGPSSLMHRIHSTSRSSNTNDDLMEMDFPESGNSRAVNSTNPSGGQSTWMDGSRRSGAASSSSSTDSLRRTPTGSRPRTNSRSSHSRPNKLEALQSIGEKSSKVCSTSDRSPCLKTPFVGIAIANEETSSVESGTTSKLSPKSPEGGTMLAVQRPSEVAQVLRTSPKLVSKQTYQIQSSQDYANMNVSGRSGSSDDADSCERGLAFRKCSMPVQIRGARQTSKLTDFASDSGEYVSIDMSRGYSTSPGKFMITTSPTVSTMPPLTVTSRASSTGGGDNYSIRFPTVSNVTSSSSSILPMSSTGEVHRSTSNDYNTSASTAKPLPSKQEESKQVLPEYVNLQFALQRTSQLHRPITTVHGGFSTVSCVSSHGGQLSSQNDCGPQKLVATHLQRLSSQPESDYAVMDPSMNSKSSCLLQDCGNSASAVRSSDDVVTGSIRNDGTYVTEKSNLCSASDADCDQQNYETNPPISDVDKMEDRSLILNTPSTLSPEVQQENVEQQIATQAQPDCGDDDDDDGGGRQELNYASLDLGISGAAEENVERQPRQLRDSRSASSLSSGSLSSLDELLTPLSYAKIDFAKSEGLRCATTTTPALGNRL